MSSSTKTDVRGPNPASQEPIVTVNKVNWFLTEAQEQQLIFRGITDVVDSDVLVQAHTLYDVLVRAQGLTINPIKVAPTVSAVISDISDISDCYLLPDKASTFVDIPTTEMLRTNLRLTMYDILDAINFMLPDIKTSATYSVYKQLYDTSDLTLAVDLFIIKVFNKKLIKMVEHEGDCPNLTHMGNRVDTAINALTEALRVRLRAEFVKLVVSITTTKNHIPTTSPQLDLEGLDVLMRPSAPGPPPVAPSTFVPTYKDKDRKSSPMIQDEDSFMDVLNTMLHSPKMDPFNVALPPLPPTFRDNTIKSIAKAIASRPPSAVQCGTVLGMPSLPNSARSDMIESYSNRTSGVILVSPRMMDDGCMGFDVTNIKRIPSLTVSERMAFM